MGRDKKKEPKAAIRPTAFKAIPPRATDLDPRDRKLVIRFNALDLEGPWCLSRATPRDLVNIMTRLRSFETMKVSEIFRPNSEEGKHYPVDELPNNDAVKRLDELPYGDQVTISRLRIDGPGRLYGFLRGHEFFALWWDPTHEIWPSTKRNT